MEILLPNSQGGLEVVEEKLSTVDLHSSFKDSSKRKVVQCTGHKKNEVSYPFLALPDVHIEAQR